MAKRIFDTLEQAKKAINQTVNIDVGDFNHVLQQDLETKIEKAIQNAVTRSINDAGRRLEDLILCQINSAIQAQLEKEWFEIIAGAVTQQMKQVDKEALVYGIKNQLEKKYKIMSGELKKT